MSSSEKFFYFLITQNYIFLYIYYWTWVCICHGVHIEIRGQHLGHSFSFQPVVLRIELRLSGLAAGTFPHWVMAQSHQPSLWVVFIYPKTTCLSLRCAQSCARWMRQVGCYEDSRRLGTLLLCLAHHWHSMNAPVSLTFVPVLDCIHGLIQTWQSRSLMEWDSSVTQQTIHELQWDGSISPQCASWTFCKAGTPKWEVSGAQVQTHPRLNNNLIIS